MKTFQMKVTDRRGKYEAKVYAVEAEQEFNACAKAVDKFIKENGHPPYQPGKRMSVYYSRFNVECVGAK
jgi:hypothetical protein